MTVFFGSVRLLIPGGRIPLMVGNCLSGSKLLWMAPTVVQVMLFKLGSTVCRIGVLSAGSVRTMMYELCTDNGVGDRFSGCWA